MTGSSLLSGGNIAHAFRHDGTPGSGGVMRDLGTLGGTDSDAYAVNNSGQVAGLSKIAGNSVHHAFRYDGTPGSGTRAFLLDASALVPEPASVSLLALGGATLLLRRDRRFGNRKPEP